MVALGFAMLGLGFWSLVLRLRGRLYEQPWMHRAAVLMGPAGFVAVLAGMDHNRSWSAALHNLWPSNDGSIGFPYPSRSDWLFPRRFHSGLFCAFRCGSFLYCPPDEQAARSISG